MFQSVNKPSNHASFLNPFPVTFCGLFVSNNIKTFVANLVSQISPVVLTLIFNFGNQDHSNFNRLGCKLVSECLLRMVSLKQTSGRVFGSVYITLGLLMRGGVHLSQRGERNFAQKLAGLVEGV